MSTTKPCFSLARRSGQRRSVWIGALLPLIPVHVGLAASIPGLDASHIQPLSLSERFPGKETKTWYFLGVATGLVLLGGLFAGLTIALMSQDETHLKVISSSGDKDEKKNAARVLWLLKKGKHWVLVTLLLCNVIVNETLPIVLHKSFGGGGWIAVASSTAMIVIFGEILPQAVCVRHALSIGAWTSYLVFGLMLLIGPVAWPTARLLDKTLGDDPRGTVYKKAGLKTFIELHKTAEQLIDDEATIISSTLDLKDKPLSSIMTKIEHVLTMSMDTIVDEAIIEHVLEQGYSRIPISASDDSTNFTGMLLIRRLIGYNPADRKQIQDFSLVALPETSARTSSLEILNYFQEGKSHMVLVSSSPGQGSGALGIVTLEDVLEEIIGEEIIDESDVFDQTHRPLKRLLPALKRQNACRASLSELTGDLAFDKDPLLIEQNERSASSHSGSIVEKATMVNGVEKVVLEMRSGVCAEA